MKKILLFSLLFLSISFGQSSIIDSLESELRINELSDIARVDILNQLAYLIYRIDLDKTTKYADEANLISKIIGYKKGLAESYRCIGIPFLFKGDYDSSRDAFNKSLQLYEELGDRGGIAKVIGNIGLTYAFQGDFKTALNYYFNSLSVVEELKDQHRVAITLNNIGEIHLKLHNYDEAKKYFEKQLPIFMEFDDSTHLVTTYANLADTYQFQGDYSTAQSYCEKGIKIAEVSKLYPYMCSLYTIMGRIHYATAREKSALNYFIKAIEYSEASADIEFKWKPFYSLAEYFKDHNNFEKAKSYYRRALNISIENKFTDGIVDASKGLYETSVLLNDYKSAFQYLKINKQIGDSLLSESNIRKITTLEIQHSYMEQERQQELERERQELIRNFLLVGLVMVLILAFLIFRENKLKSKINKQLHIANATKDKFITIIAHDLKNPIHYLLGSSELFLKEYSDLEEKERLLLVEGFHNSVRNVHALLAKLLLWANSQRGQIKLNKENHSLRELVISSIEPCLMNANNKSLKIANEIDKEIGVFCDKNSMSTVISNLVSNAIKFTPDNGQINISSITYETQTEIHISDNGIGMDEATIQKLFKLDESNTRLGTKNESGTGLGLIICKEFIEQNGGSIRIESEINKGSTFIFTIPNE